MSYFKPYKYVKDESNNGFFKVINKKFVFDAFGYPAILTILGLFFLISQILLPFILFKTQDKIAKPVSSSVLGVASGFSDFEFSELEGQKGVSFKANIPKYYYLSIPELGIKDALVETFPKNLDPSDSLGHYVGSSLPGLEGNTFIYGHSVLPAFYNPKNYKSIFSTLHTLSEGDKIIIKYNNNEYEYRVKEKEILYPSQVDPLNSYEKSYLEKSTITLMTCSPPGTKLKRLLVYAVLVN